MAEAAHGSPRTPAEWLAWEEGQPERYELVGREPRLMAGGTDRHSGIVVNMMSALRDGLRGGPWRVRADLKVQLAQGRWTRPDLFVRCSPRRGEETLIDDPIVVVEVLSPGAQAYDTQEKRWAYQEIASLRHLVLVALDRPKAEVASRDPDGTWRSVFFVGLEAELRLEALAVVLPLAVVYDEIDFGTEASAASAQSETTSEASTTPAKT